jgi:hypothetical protein
MTQAHKKNKQRRSWIVYPALALFGIGSFLSGYLLRSFVRPSDQESAAKTPEERDYEEFKKQAGALEFENELGDAFSKLSARGYIDLLKTGQAIELVKKLGSEFSNGNISEYTRLLHKGVDLETILRFSSSDISGLSDNLDNIPSDLVQYLGSSERHSIEVAASNPIFGTDEEKLKYHIKQKLKEKDHLPREDADYVQDLSQLEKVSNINSLYLIKGYLDYFEDSDNLRQISGLMNDDLKDNFSEHGGVVFCINGKYQFKSIQSALKARDKNLENNEKYLFETWTKYLGVIGYFHFHSTQDDNSKYSGPSGSEKALRYSSAKSRSFARLDNGDLSSLLQSSNPYKMDCVITKLEGKKFHACIYFYDKDNSEARVLSLGVYPMVEGSNPKSVPSEIKQDAGLGGN